MVDKNTESSTKLEESSERPLDEKALDYIQKTPVFSKFSSVEIARLVPYIAERYCRHGELIYQSGSDADTFYILLEGEIELETDTNGNIDTKATIKQGFLGEEAALGNPNYLYTTRAKSEKTKLLAIDGKVFCEMLDQHSDFRLRKELLLSLHRFGFDQQVIEGTINQDRQALKDENKNKQTLRKEYNTAIGWLLAFVVPVSLYFLPALEQLDQEARIFVSVFSVTILMWIFRLVPDYIAGLLTILIVLTLDITPSSVVLSGFQSSSFFMAMSVFVLSGVITSSGIAYRTMLIMLKYTPSSKFFYSLAMTITGLLMTPVIPCANGRVSLITPLLSDMTRALGYKPTGTEATRMAIAAFFGVTLFSAVFLTAKPINFVIFGMLPMQVQSGFQWFNWMVAASVAGIVSVTLFLILLNFMFRSDEQPNCSMHHINTQIKVLGRFSASEWSAFLGIFLLIVGIVTTSVHKIQPAWIGMSIMFIFLALEAMDKKAFRGKIDWPFLFLLGTLIGLAKAISYLEIDQAVGENLSVITQLMASNIYLFVLVLAGIMFLVRIVVSTYAAVILVGSVFLPLASLAGINPWIIGFMILTFSEPFIFPYQCIYYLSFRQINEESPLYSEKSFLLFNIFSPVIRILSIYASIPLWKSLEILQ